MTTQAKQLRDIIGATNQFVSETEAKERTIINARKAFEKRMAAAEKDLAEQQTQVTVAQGKAREAIERAIGAKLVTRQANRMFEPTATKAVSIFGAMALVIMVLGVVS